MAKPTKRKRSGSEGAGEMASETPPVGAGVAPFPLCRRELTHSKDGRPFCAVATDNGHGLPKSPGRPGSAAVHSSTSSVTRGDARDIHEPMRDLMREWGR